MKNEQYKELVNRHLPNEQKGKNAIVAFIVGGLIGAFGNFLLELYSYYFHLSTTDASVYMIATLIFIACLCTALGFFDDFVKFGRMGVIIPITGFAHSMTSAGIEYRKEGPIYGLGMNIFKLAGSVILYGIVAAWIFGTLRYLLLGGL